MQNIGFGEHYGVKETSGAPIAIPQCGPETAKRSP